MNEFVVLKACNESECENGGICYKYQDICLCPIGFNGKYCESK